MTPYSQMLARELRPEAQATFVYEYQRYAKDPTIALTLTILLGIVGGESYYFGDYKRGILMTLALLSGIGVLITIPLWIVRCFTVQNDCDAYNDYLAYSLALRYWPTSSEAPLSPEPPTRPQRPNISGVPMRVN
ncbi:MAG: TM2 domain-containing protein [Vulcanimicrobiaceae bacterium]